MKAITLNPLWAVLFVHGLKKNETRSRNIFGKHTGKVLVHTSAKVSALEKELFNQDPFLSALADIGITHWNQLPVGKIIGQVEVEDVGQVISFKPEQALVKTTRSHRYVWSLRELGFGDYSEGRWITFCQNHTVFQEQLPYKGQLGLWDISIEQFNNLHVKAL